MNAKIVTLLLATSLAMTAGAASAKGCLKGAAVGGVAGHYAGHHGLAGAAVGCAIGRHRANKRDRAEAAQSSGAAQPVNTRRHFWK